MIKLIRNVNYFIDDNKKIVYMGLPSFFTGGVTGEYAKDSLNSSPCNRKMIPSTIEDLLKAIHEGKWVQGDSCAMFEAVDCTDPDWLNKGTHLRNAHHRFIAICEASKAMPDLVLPLGIRITNNPDEKMFVDTGGRLRSLQDQSVFAENTTMAPRDQRVLNAFVGGGHTSRQDGFDVRAISMLKLWNKYKDCIQTVTGFLKPNGADAKVTAAFARALWNGADINKLKRYAYYINEHAWPPHDVDENGRISSYEGDDSIATLKNWLIKGTKARTNYAITEQIFYKTCDALYKALNSKDVKSCKTSRVNKDYFPIEEQKIPKRDNKIYHSISELSEDWEDGKLLTPRGISKELQAKFNNDYIIGLTVKKLSDKVAAMLRKKEVVLLENGGKIVPVNINVAKQFHYKYIKKPEPENSFLTRELLKIN